MAKTSKQTSKKDVATKPTSKAARPDDLAAALIRDLNKEFGTRVAYNLSEAEAPTIVKRWLPTGSIQLDYAIANKREGGYPEGRLIEISGMEATGKSHLAYETAREVQRMGGLVVYIDTENATPVDKLANVGIDVRKRFVYCDTHCTEEVFSILESTITKAKSVLDKNIPILAIWDSVAATSPKAELEGNYDQETMGLQARVLSKGFRKIMGVLGQNNVTLICINQLRSKIGVMYGDPMVSPGGNAIPFHASVRPRLGSGQPIKDKDGRVIGIKVTVSLKKNKVGPPHRHFEMEIHFGRGIVEHEQLFDECNRWIKKHGPVEKDGKKIEIGGDQAWKHLLVTDAETGEVELEKKFTKSQFDEIIKDEAYGPIVAEVFDRVLTQEIKSNVDESEEVDTSEDSDGEAA
jgi:recombination protein RecA